MGPPIMVIVAACVSPRLASSDTAASTGTVGWHTEITCTFGADVADELLHVGHVVVQVERALSSGTMRASVQSVMKTLWSCSRLLTVSRSSVEWWPDSGATTSTVGCSFITSSARRCR
jgi:hypothetical protein